MERRGKRRTRGQRIGEKGEGLYKTWGTDNGLTSQKLAEDYGIDFFSLELRPISKSIEEATGTVLASQVRSIEGARRKRIKLDRTDAETALRLRIPYCLVAIDVSEKRVYHRFLDEAFLIELDEFLNSSQKTLTLRLDSFAQGTDRFRDDLARAAEQGRQYRLRILKAEREIISDIPGASLHVIQDSGAGFAAVHLPWITQAFAIEAGSQAEAAEFVFDKGTLPPPEHPRIRIRPIFKDAKDIASGPIVIQGRFEEERNLFVEKEGKHVIAPFGLRRIGDERAYVGESGLILIISDPREIDGIPKHLMSVRLTETGAKPLIACDASGDFLRMLKPNAKLNEQGREGIPISRWPDLDKIGPAVEAIFNIIAKLDVKLDDALLADINDEEFDKGISLLNAMLNGVGIERLVPGFLAGPAREKPYSESNWKPAGFRIPVVFNIKNHGVIVWVTGKGSVYFAGKPSLICGFRPERQESWEVKFQDSRLPVSKPVSWISTEWPGIPAMPSREIFDKGMVVKGPIENPIGGDVWEL